MRLTTRQLYPFCAALALATAAFWSVMVTDPPKTEAAVSSGATQSLSETYWMRLHNVLESN